VNHNVRTKIRSKNLKLLQGSFRYRAEKGKATRKSSQKAENQSERRASEKGKNSNRIAILGGWENREEEYRDHQLAYRQKEETSVPEGLEYRAANRKVGKGTQDKHTTNRTRKNQKGRRKRQQ